MENEYKDFDKLINSLTHSVITSIVKNNILRSMNLCPLCYKDINSILEFKSKRSVELFELSGLCKKCQDEKIIIVEYEVLL